MVIGYAVTAAISLLLIVLYQTLIKNKEFWQGLLFLCVAVVNVGYLLLSLAPTLHFAVFANDVAYLGSVFLSLCMFLAVAKLCGFAVKKRTVAVLVVLAGVMFLIVATAGFLPWYYKSIAIGKMGNTTVLIKEYGVLHPLYMMYLMAYFVAMIGAILRSAFEKRGAGQKFAGMLTVIVLINLFVWFFEKFGDREFEFLSVSYIISEVLLVLLYWMMQDYVHKSNTAGTSSTPPAKEQTPQREQVLALATKKKLTQKECEVLERLLAGQSRKVMAAELHVSENTVKTHVKHVYEKLGVSGREELVSLLQC